MDPQPMTATVLIFGEVDIAACAEGKSVRTERMSALSSLVSILLFDSIFKLAILAVLG